MSADKHYCWKCEVNEIYKPEYCCNGYLCGCEGYPIDPPFCDDCFEEATRWKLAKECEDSEFT